MQQMFISNVIKRESGESAAVPLETLLVTIAASSSLFFIFYNPRSLHYVFSLKSGLLCDTLLFFY